jgi:hypothetical protein
MSDAAPPGRSLPLAVETGLAAAREATSDGVKFPQQAEATALDDARGVARNLFEEAQRRQAWRLRDVAEPTDAQLSALTADDIAPLAPPDAGSSS